MFDIFGAWRRLAAAGTTMQATGQRGVTMMGGARDVIAARGAIIGEAVLSPWTADQRELGRMLPEKVMAMSHAGSAAASVLWDSQALWMKLIQHLGGMAMRGRVPTPTEMVDLGERNATLMLRSAELSARLGAAALAPFSRQVKANVRRLGGKRSKAVRTVQRQSH
jgi:hypothetical protein